MAAMKIVILIATVLILLITGVLYIRPPWVNALIPGQCVDGGSTYFIDATKNADYLAPAEERNLALRGLSELSARSFASKYECGPFEKHRIKKDGAYAAVSRLAFSRIVSRYNETCNGCVVVRGQSFT